MTQMDVAFRKHPTVISRRAYAQGLAVAVCLVEPDANALRLIIASGVLAYGLSAGVP